MTAPRVVQAAGCVVWRRGDREPEVLLVHRPRYSDWSFPKGKLDAGETAVAAAVREVWEETGLRVRLGPRLRDDHYTIARGQPKVVSYWAAAAPKDADISTYEANNEIDELRWSPVSEADSQLSYPRDVEMLQEFLRSGHDSSPLLVIRHTQARSRKAWHDDDSERPLNTAGHREAEQLIPLLRAYGVRRIVSSDAVRCVDTVLPYVNADDVKFKITPALSEDGAQTFRVEAADIVQKMLDGNRRAALCSHRPVLPTVFEALGIPPVSLPPGGVVVVHRKDGNVLATEQV